MLKSSRPLAVLIALAVTASVEALPAQRLVKVEISSRITAYDGKTFGQYGPYERIAAIAHMRIDPTAAANRRIVDLAVAPRDANGLVNYDIDLIILRPRNAARAR